LAYYTFQRKENKNYMFWMKSVQLTGTIDFIEDFDRILFIISGPHTIILKQSVIV